MATSTISAYGEWVDVTSSCNWNTTYVDTVNNCHAWYNARLHLLMLDFYIFSECPNQQQICAVPYTPYAVQRIGSAHDSDGTHYTTRINTNGAIVSSHSQNKPCPIERNVHTVVLVR